MFSSPCFVFRLACLGTLVRGQGDIMITIDLIDEHVTASVNAAPLKLRVHRDESRYNQPVNHLAHQEHNRLLQAAHAARLAHSATRNGISIDVHRYLQASLRQAMTLVDRYTRAALR